MRCLSELHVMFPDDDKRCYDTKQRGNELDDKCDIVEEACIADEVVKVKELRAEPRVQRQHTDYFCWDCGVAVHKPCSGHCPFGYSYVQCQ